MLTEKRSKRDFVLFVTIKNQRTTKSIISIPMILWWNEPSGSILYFVLGRGQN
ncbi:hypothetical protein CEXT_655831, partial [Caerostris extrusa]